MNVVVNISLTPVNIGPDDSYDLDNTSGLPLSSASQVPNVNIYVVQPHPSLTQVHPCVGDALSTLLVAQSPKVEKGHEASLWSLKLQGGVEYYVIPTTSKKGQRCKLPIFFSSLPPSSSLARGLCSPNFCFRTNSVGKDPTMACHYTHWRMGQNFHNRYHRRPPSTDHFL